jgi:hypothetical protein
MISAGENWIADISGKSGKRTSRRESELISRTGCPPTLIKKVPSFIPISECGIA